MPSDDTSSDLFTSVIVELVTHKLTIDTPNPFATALAQVQHTAGDPPWQTPHREASDAVVLQNIRRVRH